MNISSPSAFSTCLSFTVDNDAFAGLDSQNCKKNERDKEWEKQREIAREREKEREKECK